MYKHIKVPGNGSCFYHSVVTHLTTPVKLGKLCFSPTVKTLRNLIASILAAALKNPNHEYHSLLLHYSDEQNMSPKKYIVNTKKCMWAGPLEIQILADVLKKRIQVYNYTELKKYKHKNGLFDVNCATPLIDFGNKRRKRITILIKGYKPNNNQFGVHYDALVKSEK